MPPGEPTVSQVPRVIVHSDAARSFSAASRVSRRLHHVDYTTREASSPAVPETSQPRALYEAILQCSSYLSPVRSSAPAGSRHHRG